MSSLRGLPLLLVGVAMGCGARDLNPRDGAGGTGATGGATAVDAGSGSDARPEIPTVVTTLPVNCGNGILDPEEQCDDFNRAAGDGCGSLCQIECYWSCGSCGPPGPCVITPVCGDGLVDSPEACDDGNRAGGDGCAADCATIELGWRCPVGGRRCVPTCGDGHVVGPEACDDLNTLAGDGCSDVCLVEPSAIRCGDGMRSRAPKSATKERPTATPSAPVARPAASSAGTAATASSTRSSSATSATTTPPHMAARAARRAAAPYCGDGILEPDFGEQCRPRPAQRHDWPPLHHRVQAQHRVPLSPRRWCAAAAGHWKRNLTPRELVKKASDRPKEPRCPPTLASRSKDFDSASPAVACPRR